MTSAARSVVRYTPFFKQRGAGRILDYGAGTLRNAAFLTRAGFDVFAADLPEQVRRMRACAVSRMLAGILDTDQLTGSRLNADLVVSTYVFNIIPDGIEKERYLENIIRNLRPGGYFLIEVRCRQESSGCGRDCRHYMKCSDCAKTYSHEELDAIFSPYGFSRLCHYYRHHALAVVYRFSNRESGIHGKGGKHHGS